MTAAKVYLDYAATAPLLPEARAAMLAVWDGDYGNASSLHTPGHAAHAVVETARTHIARLINATPEEIVFTSGGSEANNTVMETFRGQKIATSAIEHPSVLEAAQARSAQFTELPVDQSGYISMPAIEAATQACNLISVMLANNEIGTIEPVKEIAKLINAQRAKPGQDAPYLHSDATQALGKIRIDVKALGVDYLTMSAHKIGGPIGIGALYVRKGSPYRALIMGGHQEDRRRAGTTNTAAIAGFGAAAQWCLDEKSDQKWAAVAKLRDALRHRILQEVPYSSCNSPETDCLPNILNMSFQAAEGESIQLYLDAEDVIVSTGSACAAGDIQPSHVLMAVAHDAEVAHSSIRFSLGLETTPADLERVMLVLPKIVKRLQGISTVKIKEVTK